MLPGSEPWFGSVRPKQPIHWPLASLGRYFCFCASVPNSLIGTITSERLHAHHRAVAGVDALDLARDQAVADVVEAGAAVGLGDGRPEQAELAHLAEDRRVGLLVAEGLEHARREAALAVVARGVAHGAFVVAELLVEQQGVVPVESGGFAGHDHTPSRGVEYGSAGVSPRCRAALATHGIRSAS